MACALPNTDPVHKISIIPRGVGALGYVLRRPGEDRYLTTQSELESNIKVALGGTLAEELIYGEISGGASSDLVALNATTGEALWHAGLNGSVSNGPITYELDGSQYVIVGAGDTLWAFVMNQPQPPKR